MKPYKEFYVLVKSDEPNWFLTEDKTFTIDLDRAETFESEEEANEIITAYKLIEQDDDFSGDYSVHNIIRVAKVTITVN